MSGHSQHRAASPPVHLRRDATAEKRRRHRVIVALVLGAQVLWPSSTAGGVDVPSGVFAAPGTTYVTAGVRSVQVFSCQGVGSAPGSKVHPTWTNGPGTASPKDVPR